MCMGNIPDAKSIFRVALYSAMMHAVKGAEGNEAGGWHLPVCLAVYTISLAIGTWRAWIYIKKYINDTMYSRLRDTEVAIYNAIEDMRRGPADLRLRARGQVEADHLVLLIRRRRPIDHIVEAADGRRVNVRLQSCTRSLLPP